MEKKPGLFAKARDAKEIPKHLSSENVSVLDKVELQNPYIRQFGK